jgi:hypothetical protein
MWDRTDKLAQELVRQAALKLPESTFLGWRHFLHELNKFVNEYIRKQPGDPLTFVTLHGESKKDSAVLNVYIGENEHYNTDPEKLINGVKYFLGEMGIQVQSIQRRPGESDSMLVAVSGISKFEEPAHHGTIKNTWMKNALRSGDAIDVRMTGVEVEPGVFRLTEFISEVTYVDGEDEAFIQSIGKDLESGEILAATDGRFYQNDDFECIYLH